MDYKGTLIEESLADRGVLESVRILKTDIEPVTEADRTPWLKQWTLHSIEIPETEADQIAQELSQALENEHAWYADFRNEKWHYVIFRGRVFRIDRSRPDGYLAARDYGLSLGIPEHQLDFSPDIVV